jgi:hypothetical protein
MISYTPRYPEAGMVSSELKVKKTNKDSLLSLENYRSRDFEVFSNPLNY